jgi:hypothetical protein
MIGIIGGGLFTLQRNTAMSHHQSAPNAQSPIVLNPRTLANVMELLERAQNHAGNLSLQYDNHSIAPDLTMLECEIATAYDMLSRVIMNGVKKSPPPIQAEPKPKVRAPYSYMQPEPSLQATTPTKRQTTNHHTEQDGAGYDCRVLLDEDGDYAIVDPTCTPPAGYRQVCIKCGFDNFDTGTFYLDCPQCRLQVVHYCRYVAIAGGAA